MSVQRVTLTLRYLRESAGLTQAKLAELLDVSRITIVRWEAGTSVPDGWQIRAIARACRVAEQVVCDALPEQAA